MNHNPSRNWPAVHFQRSQGKKCGGDLSNLLFTNEDGTHVYGKKMTLEQCKAKCIGEGNFNGLCNAFVYGEDPSDPVTYQWCFPRHVRPDTACYEDPKFSYYFINLGMNQWSVSEGKQCLNTGVSAIANGAKRTFNSAQCMLQCRLHPKCNAFSVPTAMWTNETDLGTLDNDNCGYDSTELIPKCDCILLDLAGKNLASIPDQRCSNQADWSTYQYSGPLPKPKEDTGDDFSASIR